MHQQGRGGGAGKQMVFLSMKMAAKVLKQIERGR